MSSITPIETVYNGYRMRSRLEARWATFFDFLRVKYQYEPEGFKIGKVQYLPDFWLPDLSCWFEVKGTGITDKVVIKCHSLCQATKENVVIGEDPFTISSPVPVPNLSVWYYLTPLWCSGVHEWQNCLAWAECKRCGCITLATDAGTKCYGMYGFTSCDCHDELGNEFLLPNTERIQQAYLAGRQARFEYGEHGCYGGQ